MTGTFSREISFSTPERPTSGFPVSSSKSSSIFFPLTPPLALISSAAISYERFSISPNFACEPVRGSSTPTLTVSAANPVDAAMTSDRIAATTTNALPTVPFISPPSHFRRRPAERLPRHGEVWKRFTGPSRDRKYIKGKETESSGGF